MTVSLIACCDKNLALGYKNNLLCHLPNDLKHFQKLTENNIVIMGRKTHESIGKHLPNRINIVLTKNKNYKTFPSCFIYYSIDDILREYKFYGGDNLNIFIIGGEQIYKQFLPYADKIYLTIINHVFLKADAFFPKLDDSWIPVSNIKNEVDEQNPYIHYFIKYERKIE